MAIELVTGHAGEGHVSSADAGRFNAGVTGTGKYVLATGEQFAASIESANLVRIASGDAVNQGRHIIIPQNTYEDAALINGTQGKTRIDVITLRYAKTTQQVEGETVTVEVASVAVVRGTEVATGSDPAVPSVTSGDIFNGDSVDDMPLYHVLITDTSITSVTPVFEVLGGLKALAGSVDDVAGDVDDVADDVTALTGRMTDAEGNITTLQGNVSDLTALLANYVVYVNVLIGRIISANNIASLTGIDMTSHIPSGYTMRKVECIGTGNSDFHCYECDVEDNSTTQIKIRLANSAGTGGSAYPWVKLTCIKDVEV